MNGMISGINVGVVFSIRGFVGSNPSAKMWTIV